MASIHRDDDDDPAFVQTDLSQCSQSLGLSAPNTKSKSLMTACYLNSAFPSTLDMIAQHSSSGDACWKGLLANANVGGENVHRGSILGAILGARQGNDKLPGKLKTGLHDAKALEQEIDDFIKTVLKAR